MEIVLSILFTLILVSFNGYFAMSEMALVSARRAVLQQKADEEGSKQAREALDVSEDSDKLLAAIQVFITLIGFGSSALATATLNTVMKRLSLPQSTTARRLTTRATTFSPLRRSSPIRLR